MTETIQLELVSNDDDYGISCIFCRCDKLCEYAFSVRRDGERALVGIHASCVAPFRERNTCGPTHMFKLFTALRAREHLSNPVHRQIVPSSIYDQWQEEALWDEYPKLSVLAEEIVHG